MILETFEKEGRLTDAKSTIASKSFAAITLKGASSVDAGSIFVTRV